MIQIYASKMNEITESENVVFGDRIRMPGQKVRIALIEPLFDDGTYEFETDKDGNIKEKQINIFQKNVIKNYLKPRELGKIPKINFFSGDEQKWFFVDEKYFKMNKYGISEQIIEEGTSSDINNSNRAKMWKQALKLIQDDNVPYFF
uniref:Uncharacterized protein n=1 Tax=Meloidogyne enterolobii TaxID=390850 RepID=A0A6V7VYA9_MELEN|nr:unnamed protein product [Meloidogyne enterolobii]